MLIYQIKFPLFSLCYIFKKFSLYIFSLERTKIINIEGGKGSHKFSSRRWEEKLYFHQAHILLVKTKKYRNATGQIHHDFTCKDQDPMNLHLSHRNILLPWPFLFALSLYISLFSDESVLKPQIIILA